MIRGEPACAFSFLRAIFPDLVGRVADMLDPVLTGLPAVQTGQVSRLEVTELLVRSVGSVYLVPGADSDRLTSAVIAMWQTAAGPAEPATTATTATTATMLGHPLTPAR